MLPERKKTVTTWARLKPLETKQAIATYCNQFTEGRKELVAALRMEFDLTKYQATLYLDAWLLGLL